MPLQHLPMPSKKKKQMRPWAPRNQEGWVRFRDLSPGTLLHFGIAYRTDFGLEETKHFVANVADGIVREQH